MELELLIGYHPLEKVSRPQPKEKPPSMPVVAWNPWTDLRLREDVAALNLTFPYQPIPGKLKILLYTSNFHGAICVL